MTQKNQNWKVETDGAAISGELHRVMSVSHRQAKGLIDARCVTINGKSVTAHGIRLKTGDEVAVNFDADTTYHELPRSKKRDESTVSILWEDKHLVFLDKPAGLLSVPTEHSDDSSLADHLVEHYRQQGIKKPRVYIAHRLDRYTTGVMVFAKTPEALNGLKDIFQEHRLQRIYKAVLVGELPENSGTLHDKLAERTRRLKMVVVANRTGSPKPLGTKSAVTHYRVIERLPDHTVVELTLETGRRNQIRVQFAERGYPLLGDKIYGSISPLLDRQALHAELLSMRHPVTDENITIKSEMPDDMETAMRKLRVIRRVSRAKAGLTGEEGLFKARITKDRKQDRIIRAKKFTKDTSDNNKFPNRVSNPADTPRQKKSYARSSASPEKEHREIRATKKRSQTNSNPERPNRESHQNNRGIISERDCTPRFCSGRPRRESGSPITPNHKSGEERTSYPRRDRAPESGSSKPKEHSERRTAPFSHNRSSGNTKPFIKTDRPASVNSKPRTRTSSATERPSRRPKRKY